MKCQAVAVLLASLAAVGLASTTTSTITTGTTKGQYTLKFSKLDGEHQTTVDITGPRMKDIIVVSGDMTNDLNTNDDFIAIGNVYHGIYIDQADSLVLVNGGNCEKRTYTTGKAPDSSKLSIPECEKIKATMRSGHINMNDNNNGGTNHDNGPIPATGFVLPELTASPISASTKHGHYTMEFSKLHGKDQTRVRVTGPGIKDSIVVSGDMPGNMQLNGNYIAVGSGRKGIYSDQAGSLVLLYNGDCVKRIYTKGKTPVSSKMSVPECEKIMARMGGVVHITNNNDNNGWSFDNNNDNDNDGNSHFIINNNNNGKRPTVNNNNNNWSSYGRRLRELLMYYLRKLIY